MRFLVTADVHLHPDHPERLEALREIVAKGEEHDVDHLLVAGDLFDEGSSVEDLKSEVREIFSGNGFHSFVIPGNHDADSYRDEDYLGDDVSVLSDRPLEAVDFDDLRLLAVPYTEDGFESLVDPLYDAGSHDDGVDVVLMHGTLSTETGGGFGGETRYLPFTPEQLLEADVDVVFAGHVHSSASHRSYGDGGVDVVVPGSPVSITRSETGRRRAWLYDIGKDLRTVDLPTRHYVHESLEVQPGEEEAEIQALQERLESRSLDDAVAYVEPRGFVGGNPEEFHQDVEEALEDVGVEDHVVDSGTVENASVAVESDLYQEFIRKLEQRDSVEGDRRRVRETFLRAMSRVRRE